MNILFWFLTLGAPAAIGVTLFALNPVLFWDIWEWLIGTQIGRTVLMVSVVALTALCVHHVVYRQGYDARAKEDATAISAANAAVVRLNAANERTSEAVAATTRTNAAVARAKSDNTTRAAVARIRVITRTITVQHCDPPTGADTAAQAAIDAEAQAAVDRARAAGTH